MNKNGCNPHKDWGSVEKRTFEQLFNVYRMYRRAGKFVDVTALAVNSGWDISEVPYLLEELEKEYTEGGAA